MTHGTVSRALHGDPRVKPETTERIVKLARELGYSPSRVARGLRTRRTDTLGIIISFIADPFYGEVIGGVHDVVTRNGYSLFVASTEHEDDATRNLWEQRVDGLFVGCLPRAVEPFRALTALPIVYINRVEDDSSQLVYNRDDLAIGACVEHLVAGGHTRIGYLGNRTAGGETEVRRLHLEAELKKRGLSLRLEDVFYAQDSHVNSGLEASTEWLAHTLERPTALMCYNDLLAIGLLRACRTIGLKVPDDLSVVGFDDIELAAYVEPPLTTFAQPKYELGKRAGTMMLQLLRGEKPVAEVLMGNLVTRASTRPLTR